MLLFMDEVDEGIIEMHFKDDFVSVLNTLKCLQSIQPLVSIFIILH